MAGAPIRSTVYRYPNEQLILIGTILLVFAVIAASAVVTFCFSALFVFGAVGLSYFSSRRLHQTLVAQAQPVTFQTVPALAEIVRECVVRLDAGPVDVFAVRSPVLNAYTFGTLRPYSVVLFSGLLEVMDADELRFVIGHELGHARLGHTWLNTWIGGMAGIPSPIAAAALLTFAFRGWNRACEYSADRAGLLACRNPAKAISALVKLVVGPSMHTQLDFERALRQIEAEDDDALNVFSELFSTHPMLVRRIQQIREYAGSEGYKQLS